jgi:hypothetical protein
MESECAQRLSFILNLPNFSTIADLVDLRCKHAQMNEKDQVNRAQSSLINPYII